MSTHIEYWKAIHGVIDDAERTLPWGDDPRRVSWDHPDELWKNDAELAHIENEVHFDIHSLVTHFCEKHTWPVRSKSAARFILSQRLKWALNYVYVLTIPSSRLAEAAIQRPVHSGWDVIHWLLTDAYENRFPPEPYIPMIFSPPPT